MNYLLALSATATLVWAQAPALSDVELADHVSQLMESTAVTVPGLVRASDPLRQLAAGTLTSLRTAPQDAAPKYRFTREVAAYLALCDSFPRPDAALPMAERQFSELRDGFHQLEARFALSLELANRAAQARAADPSNSARYAEADSKLLPPSPGTRVVFMGDSITDQWRLNEYFTGRDFVNRGISGQTTLEMLGRFLQDVIALKPKAVLILAGTNDIARGIKTSAIEDNLAMMAAIAKANGIKPLFASILPVSDYHKSEDPRFEMTKPRPLATIRAINLWLQDYCRKEGFTYVDYYTPMADGTGQIPADMANDGLHPNSKGYRVMAPIALEALNRTLLPVAPPPAEKPQKRRFGLLSK